MPAMACGARAGAAFPSPSPRARGTRAPPPPGRFRALVPAPPAPRLGFRLPAPRASTIDSPGSSSDFAKRMERAWLISQQPRPIPCSSCQSAGHVECKWCTGTGFYPRQQHVVRSTLKKHEMCDMLWKGLRNLC